MLTTRPGRAPARIPRRDAMPVWADPDLFFVFVTFFAALFTLRTALVAPLVFMALPVWYLLIRKERIGALVARAGPILIIPIFCLISTLWSHVPGTTLYYASEYLLTVICALMIGGSMSGTAILSGLFAAFLLYSGANLLIGLRADAFVPGAFGHNPFSGMAASKNVAGDLGALAVMIGLTMLIRAAKLGKPLILLLSLTLVVLGLGLAIAAVSTGAIASLIVGVIVLLGLSLVTSLPAPARSTALVAVSAVAGIAAVTRNIWFQPLFASVLKAGGKNGTLTGRTYIWSRAEVMIEQRPILGLGFSAFWNKGSLEAEAIWRRLYIGNRFGFNFHNSRLDILVHLGYFGLALFVVIFAIYGAVLLIRNLRSPTPVGTLFVAILCYEASRMGFETVVFGLFSHTTFLLYAALGWASRARLTMAAGEAAIGRRTRPPTARPQRPLAAGR